ncbi:MAG: biotin/lipoyl-binding protein, partial [Gammaproteobacteria bacterium]|nr:biotin/lipoyl-binding protein [Gammaproteobacteria bacterium]
MFRWILVGLFSIVYAQSQQSLPVVSMAEVKQESFQPILSVPGNLYAYNGASLSLESSGVVTNIYVGSGQKVKKGDLLVDLDNTSEKASYDAAITTAAFAEVEFKRQKELYAQGVIS